MCEVPSEKKTCPDQDGIVFIDTEVSTQTGKILDYGAISRDGRSIHTCPASRFADFIRNYRYICGHNFLEHDPGHLEQELSLHRITCSVRPQPEGIHLIPADTLYLSPPAVSRACKGR